MKLPPQFTIAPMHAREIAALGDWAAEEGWNPGQSDMEIARRADPDCFVALRLGDALAGGGSIFSYDGLFGFMGLFIMRADMRGQGFGRELWFWRRDRLLERLHPGASIGMDGVYDMVPFYRAGGFEPAYRHVRYEGIASGRSDPGVVPLAGDDFALVEAFDAGHFPVPRTTFLRAWLEQPGAHVLGIREGAGLAAFGVARPCRVGFKIGPLFARSADLATRVFGALSARVAGSRIQIDVPEANSAAVRLAERHGLSMSFGCMRMYYGPAPALRTDEIFAVTSLEFG